MVLKMNLPLYLYIYFTPKAVHKNTVRKHFRCVAFDVRAFSAGYVRPNQTSVSVIIKDNDH